MKLVAIYGEYDTAKLGRMTDDLVADLQSHGVEVLEYSLSRYTVLTPHVYIQMVDDLNKFVGRRFDVILGPVPTYVYSERLKDPSSRFKGDVIEYVLREEGL